MGLFKLNEFIASLQCGWIKRSLDNINDNWKYTLATISGNNVLNCVNDKVTREHVGATLLGFVDSFCLFKSNFAMLENNFRTAQIYCNNAFGYGRGNLNKLDDNFFQVDRGGLKRDTIINICWNDITDNDNVKSKVEVDRIFGFELSDFQYSGIKNAYRSAVNRYYNIENTSISIRNYITRFKKGSRFFHKIISQVSKNNALSNTTQFRTFFRLIDCDLPSDARAKDLFTGWVHGFYNSSMRVFLFKYYGNTLGINSRVTHFNPEINGGCTFCTLAGELSPPLGNFCPYFF